MAEVAPIQSNFSGGEFSPLAYGRVEADRYKTGLARCLNYIPTAQGGLTRRGGTYFVGETKTSTAVSRLIPFEFSTTQAYMLEFGALYIRIYKNYAPVTTNTTTITGATQGNPVVITSAAHGYSNGDRIIISGILGMTELNNREFIVANVAANTYELKNVLSVNVDGTGFTAYASGGSAGKILEVVTTYAAADVMTIKFAQSADVLYLVHPSYPPKKLSRTSDTSWTLSTITFLDGPYMLVNATSTTLTPSAATGSGVTVTASSIVGINNDTGFQTTDVGRFIRMQQGSVWGYCLITARTSTTVVTVTVINTLTSTAAKLNWRLGVWSDTTGYPSSVTFHEDRLCFGGPLQRINGSKTGDYENFAPTDTAGVVTADSAINYNLNVNDVSNIRWIASDEKGLLSGTVGGENGIRPANLDSGLLATNLPVNRPIGAYGSDDVQPVRIGNAILFIQRGGRKLRELTYFYEVEGFRSLDVSLLSEHITAPSIIQQTYQKAPFSIMWAVRSDGSLTAMNYEREPEALKVGWSEHVLGGYSDAATTKAKVESVAVIPSPDTTTYDLYVIVKRWINGRQVRFIEYMTKIFEDTDEQKDAFFVDSGLTYDSPITITGATSANPVVITANSHGFSNGDVVRIIDVIGMTEINDLTFTVANKTANTFELSGINGSAYSTYVSGGEVRKLVSVVSGLNHLEGQTVSILADGAVLPDVVVSHGRAALSFHAGTVHVGYGFNSDGQMLRIDAGSADGTSIGKLRRIDTVRLMLHRSLGLQLGSSFDRLDTITFRVTSDPLSIAPPLFTGIIETPINMTYDFDNQICFRQSQPLPSTVLAIMPDMVTQDG